MTQLNRPASPIFGTLLAGLTLVAAQAASGAPAAPSLPAERVKVLQAVVDCRKLTADAERLACFDRATAVLDEAEKTGAVVVIDQARVREVKRQAFGLSLPSLSLFGGGAGATRDEPIKQVELSLSAVREIAPGRFMFSTAEGATWVQLDGDLPVAPRKGGSLVVSPGMLGSFFCKVDHQPSVRCKREN
jgi:hypothetical protein